MGLLWQSVHAIEDPSALTKATDSLVYPKNATTREKDEIFHAKVSKLANGHTDLSSDVLKSTYEFQSALVAYSTQVKNVGDTAIESAGVLILRDLSIVGIRVVVKDRLCLSDRLGA